MTNTKYFENYFPKKFTDKCKVLKMFGNFGEILKMNFYCNNQKVFAYTMIFIGF